MPNHPGSATPRRIRTERMAEIEAKALAMGGA